MWIFSNFETHVILSHLWIWHTFTYIWHNSLVKFIRRRGLDSNHVLNQPFLYVILERYDKKLK